MTQRNSIVAKSALLLTIVLASIAAGYLLASRSGASKSDHDAQLTAAAHRDSAHEPDRTPPIELPQRHAAEVPPPGDPPDLPASCANPPEFTATVSEQRRGTRKTSIVSRTAHRVHVRPADGGGAVEWLFVQNPVDPRRASGAKIDHHHRVILEYDDSALRNGGIARGWAEVVSFGVDPALLHTLVREDSEVCAPLRMSTGEAHAAHAVELANVRPGVDASLLVEPRLRFPNYRVMDAIDWLEDVHDHGEGDVALAP